MLKRNPRAVVTGAGSGLGRAFCLELARRGARVVASDVNLPSAAETVREIGGKDVHAVRCDVSKRGEVEALHAEAERLLGGVDLLVNNAGVAVAGQVGEIPESDWKWIVDINFWGPIHGCEAFLPGMKAQRSGHIINVASMAGLLCVPGMAPYNMTKSALIALSETLDAELAEHGVGVTVLCPSFFRTNIMTASRGGGGAASQLAETMMARSKLTAADVAVIALDAAEHNRLYALPHRDGRWLWRLKRSAPQRFHRMIPAAGRRIAKRMGIG